jgi:hypothetical protein
VRVLVVGEVSGAPELALMAARLVEVLAAGTVWSLGDQQVALLSPPRIAKPQTNHTCEYP